MVCLAIGHDNSVRHYYQVNLQSFLFFAVLNSTVYVLELSGSFNLEQSSCSPNNSLSLSSPSSQYLQFLVFGLYCF